MVHFFLIKIIKSTHLVPEILVKYGGSLNKAKKVYEAILYINFNILGPAWIISTKLILSFQASV